MATLRSLIRQRISHHPRYAKDLSPEAQKKAADFATFVSTIANAFVDDPQGLQAKARDYSPEGLQARRGAIVDRFRKLLAGERTRVTEARTRLAEHRARVIQGFEPNPGGAGYLAKKKAEATPLDELRRREIRDLLRARNLRPFEMQELYLTAVRDGVDADLIAAIEEAPKAFALVTPQARALADDLRLAQSPYGAEIVETQQLQDAEELLLAGIDRECAEALAGQFPIDDPPSSVTSGLSHVG